MSFFGSKFTVLKKVLVTFMGLFGAPRSNSALLQWFGAPHSDLAPGELWPSLLRSCLYLKFLVTLLLVSFIFRNNCTKQLAIWPWLLLLAVVRLRSINKSLTAKPHCNWKASSDMYTIVSVSLTTCSIWKGICPASLVCCKFCDESLA